MKFVLFKNQGNMERIDESVYDRADEGLLRLIEKAKVAALSEEEQNLYDASMKLLEDEIDMEHGYKRGMVKGIQQGREEERKNSFLTCVHPASPMSKSLNCYPLPLRKWRNRKFSHK